jgi:hypothetical protein
MPQILGIPDKIILTKSQDDSVYIGKVTIRHCEDKFLTITDVEVTPPNCLKKYTIEHDKQKNLYSIIVLIDVGYLPSPSNVQLTFKIESPCQRSYSIPLICP